MTQSAANESYTFITQLDLEIAPKSLPLTPTSSLKLMSIKINQYKHDYLII